MAQYFQGHQKAEIGAVKLTITKSMNCEDSRFESLKMLSDFDRMITLFKRRYRYIAGESNRNSN